MSNLASYIDLLSSAYKCIKCGAPTPYQPHPDIDFCRECIRSKETARRGRILLARAKREYARYIARETRKLERGEAGFTLVELMLAVAIIGILAMIAIPQFRDCIRRSQEGVTRGNLGTLRSALSIYYGDNEGVYPVDDLTSLTIGARYLKAIPLKYSPPYHRPGNGVGTGLWSDMPASRGAWFYINDPLDADYGKIVVNCVHGDLHGNPWSAY